jgi:translation initiation factor IF-3
VKLTCRFRGREITHPEVAMQQFEFLLSKMDDLVNVEQRPSMEGRAMAAIVSPKPGVLHKLAQERIQKERLAQRTGTDGTESSISLDDSDASELDDEFEDDQEEESEEAT